MKQGYQPIKKNLDKKATPPKSKKIYDEDEMINKIAKQLKKYGIEILSFDCDELIQTHYFDLAEPITTVNRDVYILRFALDTGLRREYLTKVLYTQKGNKKVFKKNMENILNSMFNLSFLASSSKKIKG